MSTDAWLTDKTVTTRKDVIIIESRWRYLGGREGNVIGVEIQGGFWGFWKLQGYCLYNHSSNYMFILCNFSEAASLFL